MSSAYTRSRKGKPIGRSAREEQQRGLAEGKRLWPANRGARPVPTYHNPPSYNVVRDRISRQPSKDRFKVPGTAYRRKPPLTRG